MLREMLREQRPVATIHGGMGRPEEDGDAVGSEEAASYLTQTGYGDIYIYIYIYTCMYTYTASS